VKARANDLVMEFLAGGSCLDLVCILDIVADLKLKPGPMDESHIAIVCREILEGLVYLHRQGKVTPNNMYLT
jgi:serine/threonine-protein kinase 24/25/MST4